MLYENNHYTVEETTDLDLENYAVINKDTNCIELDTNVLPNAIANAIQMSDYLDTIFPPKPSLQSVN